MKRAWHKRGFYVRLLEVRGGFTKPMPVKWRVENRAFVNANAIEMPTENGKEYTAAKIVFFDGNEWSDWWFVELSYVFVGSAIATARFSPGSLRVPVVGKSLDHRG